MLTWRTFLLTATGLLIGYVAAAQTPSASSDTSTQSMLFWFVVGILGLVVLVVLLAGTMISVQIRPHLHQDSAPEPTQPQLLTPTAETENSLC